jgi:predicted transcriptional regulator
MARTKTREITIIESQGTFSIFKKPSSSKESYDFSGILALRQLLTSEKLRILHIIKTRKPSSIYELSKILGRNFQSVNNDLKLLERFGFIELIYEKKKNRIKHRPEIIIDSVNIQIRI